MSKTLLLLFSTVGTMAFFSVTAGAAAVSTVDNSLAGALILFGAVIAGAGVILQWIRMK
jgi:hypothetical protein